MTDTDTNADAVVAPEVEGTEETTPVAEETAPVAEETPAVDEAPVMDAPEAEATA